MFIFQVAPETHRHATKVVQECNWLQALEVGVDPVHFGIIMMLNLGIGLVTPPVGSVLFVGSAVGKIPVTALVKTIWPFYLTLIAALVVITFVPALSLWLPGAFGG